MMKKTENAKATAAQTKSKPQTTTTKTPAPKASAKTPAAKAEKTIPTSAHLTTDEMFPVSIALDGADGKIKVYRIPNPTDLADLAAKMKDGAVLASYWTAEQIKYYSYAKTYGTAKIESFPNNLDIRSYVDFEPSRDILMTKSEYTTAYIVIRAFDVDARGVCVVNGAEFSLYNAKAPTKPAKPAKQETKKA